MTPPRQKTREEKFQLQKLRKEKLASFYYDLAKLSFGGLVIGVLQTLMTRGHLDINSLPIILIGGLATIGLAILGFLTTQE